MQHKVNINNTSIHPNKTGFYISIVSCILLLGVAIQSNAQDLIIKTDSSKIFCKVTRYDKQNIYYVRFNIDREESVRLKEVLKCTASDGSMIYQDRSLGPWEPSKPIVDSLNPSDEYHVSIQTLQDSIIRLNTLLQENNRSKSDSIFYRKKICLYHGARIGIKEMMGLMQKDPEATEEIDMAYRKHKMANAIMLCGSMAIIGATCLASTARGPALYGTLGGLFLYFASLPFSSSAIRHLHRAVTLYNTDIANTARNTWYR